MGIGGILQAGTMLFGAYNQYKQGKEQKKSLKKAEPKSVEELQNEARDKSEANRQVRAKARKKYGRTDYSSATGAQGQLKDKVGQ